MDTHRSGLVVLAAACFVFVTAETLPVGLLPQLSHDLSVSEADVGLLLTSYAVVAAVTTIPVTALTMKVPRRRLLTVTLAVFAVSQLIAACAPSFAVLTASRLVCALVHGVFWSAITPVAARLVAPDRAGRATALVFLGNSLAIVLGVPLGTALGQALGWRVTLVVLAVGGTACALGLVRVLPALPALPRDLAAGTGAQLRAPLRALRSGPVTAVCLVTLVLALGHFTAYTFFAPLVRRDGGLVGAGLSALLLGYGAVGVLGTAVVGRLVDRRPGPLLVTLTVLMALALAGLAPVLGAVPTVVAGLVWGGTFTAIPAVLQAAVLRVAPQARDAASAVYVVAFQIGIGGGALLGERLVGAGHLARLPALAAAFTAVAALVVVTARGAFPARVPREQPAVP